MTPHPTARDDATAPHAAGEAGAPIGVWVNGDPHTLGAGTSVAALIDQLDLGGRRLAIACNKRVIPRSSYDSHRLANGDRLEILEAVGGG